MSAAEQIPCDHVIAQLWEYIDGEISEDRARLVRAHLDICSHCYPQYNFQRAFVDFLGVHAQSPIPSALRHRVFDLLLREDGGSASEPARGDELP